MNPELVQNITKLRGCVAYLGEKEQHSWWNCSFLSRTGDAFLRAVFPKTGLLARLNGASTAAQVQHDEYVGVGNVYHLFRLPENIEHRISQSLTEETSVGDCIVSQEVALSCLSELAADSQAQGQGPLLLKGHELDGVMVSQLAAAYHSAFQGQEHVYPYFRSQA